MWQDFHLGLFLYAHMALAVFTVNSRLFSESNRSWKVYHKLLETVLPDLVKPYYASARNPRFGASGILAFDMISPLCPTGRAANIWRVSPLYPFPTG